MPARTKVLLISMPDQILLFNWLGYFIPNLGLTSLAGNVDKRYCEVKILDLVYKARGVTRTLIDIIREHNPDLVGLTAMSFQFASAVKAARIIKSINPRIKIMIGGYHAALNSEEIVASQDSQPFDFIIRGEGEETFSELIEAFTLGRGPYNSIKGLTFRVNGEFHSNPSRELIDLSSIALPDRSTRIFSYVQTGFNPGLDVVETSRGCYMSCNFCSIMKMYGKSFRTYDLERVIEDIRIIKSMGGKRIIFVDDNITLDVARLERLCHAIVEAGLNDIRYGTQASSTGIASSEELVRAMKAANFTSVFLGIENISPERLHAMRKGNIVNHSIKAVEMLNRYEIGIMGGFIIGLPDDRREDIKNIFDFCRKYDIDIPVLQCVTPYPKTEQREHLLKEGLVINPHDFSKYNGLQVNVRTKHLTMRQIERERNKGYFFFLLRVFLFGKSKYLKKSFHNVPNFARIYMAAMLSSVILFILLFSKKWSSVSHCRFETYSEKMLSPFRSLQNLFSRHRIQKEASPLPHARLETEKEN
ncbi:MAG: radical SAM protein [Acidobacteriota bacterium]